MKRFVIAIIGGTVVLLGIGMIALPGPAVVVIPAGLAILATEFLWARRALQVFKGITARALRREEERPKAACSRLV
jgi:hypothetical protein